MVPKDERIIIQSPDGGGLGESGTRDPALIASDLARGLISPDAAREHYSYPAETAP